MSELDEFRRHAVSEGLQALCKTCGGEGAISVQGVHQGLPYRPCPDCSARPVTHEAVKQFDKAMCVGDCDKLTEMYAAALRSRDDMARDAERYRWLRDYHDAAETIQVVKDLGGWDWEGDVLSGDELDAAIDRALSARSGEGE